MLKRITALFLLMVPLAGADIVLKIVVTNPSTLDNEITVNKLLPEGINPEQVLDAGGLDVIYDEQAKEYALRKRIALKPKEERVFSARMKDIWVLDEVELRMSDGRAQEVMDTLKGKRFEKESTEIRERVKMNVAAILERQSKARIPDVSVPEHISAYNQNRIIYDSVRNDMAALEEMISAVGHAQILKKVPEGMPPSISTIWKVILSIITFIAVMTAVFFIVWASQLKKIREAEREAGLT